MKLLINDKELANFLLSCMPVPKELHEIPFNEKWLAMYVNDWLSKKSKWSDPDRELKDEEKKKFKDKLFKAVRRDLDEWISIINAEKHNVYAAYFDKIHKNIEYFIEKIGKDELLSLYKKSKYKNFVKGTGLTIDRSAQMVRRKEFNNYEEDCLIRNTVGNEELLVTKIDKNYPMWFIDSGYTNFTEPNKKWHRIVRNHLHYGKFFDAPADRLGNFKEFPKPWRKDGDIIYVIEPGPFAASIFHCDLKTWKYDVEKELRQYTDKKIKFREKAPKRERTNLHQELLDDNYYCVVSINSNAATESIWAGIPAITLDRHITNPVTKSKLSEVNDLFYGNLGSWLCMLSYSQFTKEELLNGTAIKIVKKYHV